MGEQRLIFGGSATIPKVLRASTAFWLASGLVGGILPLILKLAGAGGAISGEGWTMAAIALPVIALQVWAALRLLGGAGWARFLLTVFAILTATGAAFGPTPLEIAGLALTLAGAVLMWLPAASAFFRPPASDYLSLR